MYLRLAISIVVIFSFSINFSISGQANKNKYDVAFILRGFDNSSEYVDSLDFAPSANILMSYLNKLSFGKISTYRVFHLGIDERNPVALQSKIDIETLKSALDGWPGSRWDWLRNRTDTWKTVPDQYRPMILLAIEWMTQSQKDYTSFQESKLISEIDANLIRNKTIGMGPGSAGDYLKDLKMPIDYNPEDFLMTQFVLNTKSNTRISGGGLASSLQYFGVLDARGNAYANNKYIQANYVYFGPRSQVAPYLHIKTAIHEAIHSFGMGTHDVDGQERNLSVMVGGYIESTSMLPAWNRYFWTNWLPQSIITTDSSQVADLYDKGAPSDANLKYIYEVKKGDARGLRGEYMEKFKGKWYSYRIDGGGTLTFTSPFKNDNEKAPSIHFLDIPQNNKAGDKVTFYFSHDGQRYSKNMQYIWYKDGIEIKPGGKFIMKDLTFTIDGLSKSDEGIYHVKVVNDFGSLISQKGYLKVKCNEATIPTITKKIEACQGSAAPVFQVTPSPNHELLWYKTSSISEIPTGSQPVISTAKSGEFTFFVSQRDKIQLCESQKLNVSVFIKPSPEIPTISVDDKYNISATGNGLTWYLDGQLISESSNTFKPSKFGIYTVKSLVDGCSSEFSKPINYLITEVPRNFSVVPLIFPNPFDSVLNLQTNEFISGQYQIMVYDVLGKLVKSTLSSIQEIELNCSDLTSGVYFIEIETLDGVKRFVQRIIKK